MTFPHASEATCHTARSRF